MWCGSKPPTPLCLVSLMPPKPPPHTISLLHIMHCLQNLDHKHSYDSEILDDGNTKTHDVPEYCDPLSSMILLIIPSFDQRLLMILVIFRYGTVILRSWVIIVCVNFPSGRHRQRPLAVFLVLAVFYLRNHCSFFILGKISTTRIFCYHRYCCFSLFPDVGYLCLGGWCSFEADNRSKGGGSDLYLLLLLYWRWWS